MSARIQTFCAGTVGHVTWVDDTTVRYVSRYIFISNPIKCSCQDVVWIIRLALYRASIQFDNNLSYPNPLWFHH